LQIGLKWPKEVLQKRIYQRILSRLKPKLKSKHDMIDEVHNLHFKNKVSWKRLESFGLEYRYISQYLKKELSKEEMIEKLNTEIWHFAKRQNTWFKKDERIKWFDLSESYKRKVDGEVRGFLK
jgi:tRNA dimethylallyltransferase